MCVECDVKGCDCSCNSAILNQVDYGMEEGYCEKCNHTLTSYD